MALTRILWVENDLMPAIDSALRDDGYDLDHAFFLSEAEEYLAGAPYDVVIIDNLMAIEPEDIEAGYTAEETGRGNKAGLAFYRRHVSDLHEMRAGVLVYSVLGNDHAVREEFVEAGLAGENILYKVSEANTSYLLRHIDRVLKASGRRGR